MDFILEIFSIFFGKWILGGLGRIARKAWSFFLKIIGLGKNAVIRRSDYDNVIDVESFKDRVAGFGVIFVVFIIVVIVASLT